MDRRGFLGAILAAGCAPAIVRAESLMRTFVRHDSGILMPEIGWYKMTWDYSTSNTEYSFSADGEVWTPLDQGKLILKTDGIIRNDRSFEMTVGLSDSHIVRQREMAFTE